MGNKLQEIKNMSTETKEVITAETEQKKVGDDAVVLLGKKFEEFAKKYEEDKSSLSKKLEGIEGLLGKPSIAPPSTHEQSIGKKEEDEAPKKEEESPPWIKKLEEGISKKFEELPAALAKCLKEESVKKEEEEAPKKEEEAPIKKEGGDEDEEEEEEKESPVPPKKAKVSGAKVEDAETISSSNKLPWWEEIKAAAIREKVIEG
jgi:hypothetical protein